MKDLKVLDYFGGVYLMFGKNLNILCQMCNAFRQIFIFEWPNI